MPAFDNMRQQQVPGQCLAQRLLAVAIQAAHAAQVAAELAAFDELGQRQLFVAMAATQHFLHRCLHLRGQRFRQDQKSQAQRRKHSLAERAHVQHGRLRHQPLHGADGFAGVAEFAVVIVFDDPRAVALRLPDQLQTARRGQHGAGRILMRRRGVDQTWRLRLPIVFGCDQAFGVDAHWHYAQVAGMHRGLCPAITWILNPCRIAGVA